MNPPIHIHKAAGILIQDRRLLVERSTGKDFYIAPGGSIEPGETPRQALVRELMEEFQIVVKEEHLSDFGTFSAPAAGQEDKIVEMNIFMVSQWSGVPTADNEVEDILWVSSQIPADIKLGSIFEHDVIPRLKSADLID